MKYNNIISESLRDYVRQSLITEEDSRIKGTKNAIKRCVATIIKEDINSENVQNLSSEIWNYYVVKPIAGENRQLDEYIAIRNNSTILVKSVVKYDNWDDEFYVLKYKRLRDNFERLIQSQRIDNKSSIIDNEKGNIHHWATNRQVEDLKASENTNNGRYKYTAYKIDDYDTPIEGLGMTIIELGMYTGGQGSVPLCYTQSEDTYNQYTDDNKYAIYALLRDGWQDEPCEIGENYPLDSYGLSMIFVIVDDKNKVVYNNVRWNHGPQHYSRDVDHILSFTELNDIVGSSLMHKIGVQNEMDKSFSLTKDVESRLQQGESPSQIFDSFNEYDLRYNRLARVKYKGMYNYLTSNYDIFSDIWFDSAYSFREGVAMVEINRLRNYLKEDGTFVYNKPIDEWLDYAFPFSDGLACVEVNFKYNFMRKDGSMLLDKWYDNAVPFDDGYGTVCDDKKWNVIDTKGNFMWEEFKFVDCRILFPPNEFGCYNVSTTNGWNYLNKNLQPMSKEYFDNCLYMEKLKNDFVIIRTTIKPFKYIGTDGILHDEPQDLTPIISNNNPSMLTEDRKQQIRSIRNKIRDVIIRKTSVLKNFDQSKIEQLVDDVWNKYVEHPNNGEKRQNDEITIINQNIQRFVPFVISTRDGNVEIVKTRKLSNCWENFIQAQKQNKGVDLLGDDNIVYWNAKNEYDEALKSVRNTEYEGSYNYTAYKIDDYDTPIEGLGMTLQELGLYTGGQGAVPLCYTQSDDTYYDYTMDGNYNMYALLRDGWKGEKCEIGKDYPLDSYGLSMIFVIVNNNGYIKNSNVRWNHGPEHYTRSVDHILSYNELAKLVGSNIMKQIGSNYDVDNISLRLTFNVEQAQAEGASIYDIVEDTFEWFEGFQMIKYNDKYNFIDESEELLCDDWFDGGGDFKNGYARVCKEDKWNLIDRNGNFVWPYEDPNEWFDLVWEFEYGFAKVTKNGMENVMRTDGTLVWNTLNTDDWFNFVYPFRDKVTMVIKDVNGRRKYNFLKRDGTLISPEIWFDEASDFGCLKWTTVYIGSKLYKLTIDGELIKYKDEDEEPSITFDENGNVIEENKNLLTEDQKRTIRNKIARGIVAITNLDINSQEVQTLVDEVWNTYVKHPIEGEKRQNDEITVINQLVGRLIPYVIRMRQDGSFYVNNNKRIHDSWENLIQTQRQNRETRQWQDNQSLTYWGINKKYNDAVQAAQYQNNNNKYHYSVFKVDGYGIPIKGLGMTVKSLGNYTGGEGAVPLCYTQSDGTYNNYTSTNRDTMYALLRDGWQAEQCKIGKGYPLDSYGLSMIFVIINHNGKITTSNVRWNHGPKRYSRSVDNIFTYKELTDIVGSDVMNQIRAQVEVDKSIQMTYEVEKQLNDGEELEDIFDELEIQDDKDVIIVRFNWYYNLLVINKENMYLLSDEWFDHISRVNDDVFCVKKGTQYNIMKTDGSYLFDEWLEDAFVNKIKGQNCVTICKDHVYNILLQDGTYLFDEGYSFVGIFKNGCVRVEKLYNGTPLCNLADENGKLIWDKPVELWFSCVSNKYPGLYPVRIVNKHNLLRSDGTLLLNTTDVNEWFTTLYYHYAYELYFVRKNRKWNLITKDGKILWDKPENLWFDKIEPEGSSWGFAVKKGTKWNYMRYDGTLIWNHENPRKWFDSVAVSDDECDAIVCKKGVKYILYRHGELYERDDYGDYVEVIDFANNGKPIYADESTLIKESLKEYIKENYQMLVEGSTIKTIRNKIARSISAAIGADMNDEQVQRLTDDVWNTYVVAHNRQNREYTAINKNIERLIPYVLKKNSDHTYEIRKTSRIKNGFEALIQAQRENMEAQILDKHNNSLFSWYADKSYNDAVENAKKEVYEADHIYSAYKIEDYDIPIEGLGMTVKELGQHTGGENTAPLCYTQKEDTYNQFTHGNAYTMYALLREGWQDEPCEETEGYPYDSYGLSMIFVIIDTEDEIKFSNVRWNHGDHSYPRVDEMFTYQSLTKVVGSKIMNYICANHKFAVDYSLTLTKEFEEDKSNNNLNGRKYEIDTDEYDGYRIIRRRVYGSAVMCYNYVDSNLGLLTHRWFYSAYRFDNGCAVVRSLSNQKYNILRTDGTFVWDKPEDEWFTYAFIYYGRTDYIMVRDENGNYNLLTQDGHLFLDKWVQAIEPFDSNGVARIRIDNKLNYIRTDKTFVWDKPHNEWFDGLDRDKFQNGIAKVFIDGNPFYLDLNGNLSKTPHQNTALMESIKKNFLLLTEDQKKTIRNKIARGIAAITQMDVASQKVQSLTDEVWNAYVVHPVEGEKRQNDEITVINQLIDRLIPYVLKQNDSENYFISNNPRIHKSWENLIQTQRQNRKTQVWQDNENLLYWNTKQAYGSLKSDPYFSGQYHYTVYKVEDYNTPIEGLGMTVTKLGKYTGGQGAVPLCYTQSQGTYNIYTNSNKFNMYALLRDGWQDEPCEIGEGYPLDSYGLSMIFVIVSPNGGIEYSNVRWNHGPKQYTRRVDNIFTIKQLAQIVGSYVVNQIGINNNINSTQLTYEVEDKLARGIDWLQIFQTCHRNWNNVYEVSYKGQQNIIDSEGILLSDIWFDRVQAMDDYFIVKKENLYNLLRLDGTFIWNKPLDEWFTNEPLEFREGYTRIKVNGRANLLGKDGQLLLPYEDISQWPSRIGMMKNSLAVVGCDNGKRNFINREGKYIWNKPIEQWFDWTDRVDHFTDYIYVEREFDEDEFGNLLRLDGTLVWDKEDPHEWFDSVYYDDVYFMEKGFVKVQKNNKELMLSLTNGTLHTIEEYKKIQQQLNENTNLLTEDQERTIRNKIARGVATITQKDVASQDVQSMTDEIWNVYVKHPIEGEKRQNDEVWAINTVISRLIPYVVKQNEEGNFFVNKNSRIKDAFENLIQAQRREQQSKKQLWNNDESLTYWNVNRKYNDAIDVVNQKQTVGKYNYSIYKVNGYDTPIEGLGMTVKQLGKYTGGQGAVPLCYTQSEDTYNQYTYGNKYNMYALLRDGWQDEPCEIGEGYPLDSYGLSMIFVIVDNKNNVVYNNVRWNHGPKGYPRRVDNIFSYQELCEIVGSNVIRQIGIVSDEIDKSLRLTQYVEQKLQEKVPLFDICSDCRKVFGTDYYKFKLDGLENIIDKQGNLLSDYWFENIDYWGNGFFRVANNHKYNFILPNGSFVIDNKDTSQWFEYVGTFYYSNSAVTVKLNDKYNYIRYDGAYVWDKPWEEWFDDATSFDDKDGVVDAFVYKKSEIDDTLKANIILVDGTLMFNEWVSEDDFHEDENGNEVCQVTKNGKYNLLDISGYLKYRNFMDFDDFKKVYPKAVLQQ